MKETCFVIMPFEKGLENLWKLAISPAIKALGLEPERADDEKLGTNVIASDITRCIWDAKIIIAVLTKQNPNVMYELGLAHSAKKDVIMVAEKSDDIPFDLGHLRYLLYRPNDLSAFTVSLKQRIESTLKMNPITKHDYFPELILGSNDNFCSINPELCDEILPTVWAAKEKVYDLIKNDTSNEIVIDNYGLDLETITSLLSSFSIDLDSKSITYRGLVISPESAKIKSVCLGGSGNVDWKVAKRNINDISSLLNEFNHKNNKITLVSYDDIPVIHGFKINRDHLLISFTSFNSENRIMGGDRSYIYVKRDHTSMFKNSLFSTYETWFEYHYSTGEKKVGFN